MKLAILCLCLVSVLCLSGQYSWAENSLTKIDDNTVKVSSTAEQTYTYEDIENRINVLKGERDKVANNLNLLNANIAEWEKLLVDVEKQGIKAKVIEKQATEEKTGE